MVYGSNFVLSSRTEKHEPMLSAALRWINTVSSTYIWMGRYNHSLSFDATIMVSKNCPIIGEHVVIIFLDTIGYHSNSMTS